MTVYWPFLALIAPLVLTFTGSRTAWIWLSAAVGVLLVNLLAQIALEQVYNDDTNGVLTSLVMTSTNNRSLSGSTFSFIVNLSGISSILMPALVVAPFLFIPAHLRRARLDVSLFWSISALLIIANLAIATALDGFSFTGAPSPDANQMHAYLIFIRILHTVAVVLIAIAIARPILSWRRARKAHNAL